MPPANCSDLIILRQLHRTSCKLSENEHSMSVFAETLCNPEGEAGVIFVGLSTQYQLWLQTSIREICIDTVHSFANSNLMLTSISFVPASRKSCVGMIFLSTTVEKDSYETMMSHYVKAVRREGEMQWRNRGCENNAIKASLWFPGSIMASSSSSLTKSFSIIQEKFGKEKMELYQRYMCYFAFETLVRNKYANGLSCENKHSFLNDLKVVRVAQTRSVFMRSWKLFRDKWCNPNISNAKARSELTTITSRVFEMLEVDGFISSLNDDGYPLSVSPLDGWATFKRREYGLNRDDMEMRINMSLLSASTTGRLDTTFLDIPPVSASLSNWVSQELFARLKGITTRNLYLSMANICRKIFTSPPADCGHNFCKPGDHLWVSVRQVIRPFEGTIGDIPLYKQEPTLGGYVIFDDSLQPERTLLYRNETFKENTEDHLARFLQRLQNPHKISDFEEMNKFQTCESLSSLPRSFEKFVDPLIWGSVSTNGRLYNEDALIEIMSLSGFPFLVEPIKGGPFCSCFNFLKNRVCMHILLGLCATFSTRYCLETGKRKLEYREEKTLVRSSKSAC